MNRESWIVGEEGIRTATGPDKCFYCGAAKGGEHNPGCVIRKRTVVVRTIIEHTIDVPEDWERSTIEFTEGSSCSDNNIAELGRLVDRLKDDEYGKCTCGMLTVEYVREATLEDEGESNLFVKDLSS